jgi:hypothetical protein
VHNSYITFAGIKIELTPDFLKEWDRKRRRIWRNIERVDFKWLGNLEQVVQTLLNFSVLAAEELGGSERFHQATFLIIYDPFTAPKELGGGVYPRLKIIGNTPVFFQRLRKQVHNFLTTRYRLKEMGDQAAILAYRETMIKTFDRISNEWESGFPAIALDGTIHAVDFECDLDARRLNFKEKADYPLDFAQYPNRVSTMSEALQLTASLLRPANKLIRVIENIEQTSGNWSVQKLLCYCLDGKPVEIERFRFDAEDYESWDFFYPEMDQEVERNQKMST